MRLLRGLLPVRASRLGPEALAGVTLAALAIPECLGYARIAGMPVVTGLYTMLIPLAVFAVLGSSRHLVIGADSATAAILAAGLLGAADPGSPRYVQLAGTAALIAGGLLLAAWLVRLGFLANFLSRTVLIGFLTGVGIQVATRQLAELLGVSATGNNTVPRLLSTLRALGHVNTATLLVSASVIAVALTMRRLTPRIPYALIAVVAAIVASLLFNLPKYGVSTLGQVPQGIPQFAVPSLKLQDFTALLPTAVSMFVVILAQSAATSRSYAGKYDEPLNEDDDLLGLGTANVTAAFTGTFVVNGSPTKTQMADDAGGRSQLAQLCAGAVILLVLLFLTGPLTYLPLAALAAIVFLIGVELVDVKGMRRIYVLRRTEFVVALLTAAAVVFIGVEQGIALAIVASIVDHLRHSYEPHSSVLVKSKAGHWLSVPVNEATRTEDGLIIYRFGTSLYFANASKLAADLNSLIHQGGRVTCVCLDGAAIGDVDYSAAAVLLHVQRQLKSQGVTLFLSNIITPVRQQLDRYDFTAAVGESAYFDTAGSALTAFRHSLS